MHVSKVSSNESTVEPSFRLIRASHFSLGPQTYLAWGNTAFKHEIYHKAINILLSTPLRAFQG